MFGMDKKTKFNLLTYHNMKLFAGIVSRETTLHAFNLIRSEPFDQCKNYFYRIRYTGSTSRVGARIFRNSQPISKSINNGKVINVATAVIINWSPTNPTIPKVPITTLSTVEVHSLLSISQHFQLLDPSKHSK